MRDPIERLAERLHTSGAQVVAVSRSEQDARTVELSDHMAERAASGSATSTISDRARDGAAARPA